MILEALNDSGAKLIDEIEAEKKAKELLEKGIFRHYGDGYFVKVVLIKFDPHVIIKGEPYPRFVPTVEFIVIFNKDKKIIETRRSLSE